MKNKALGFSLFGSFMIAAFMVLVNYLTSPGFPWFIFPVFAVIWWPMSIFFYNRRSASGFAVCASLLIIAFFIILNLVTSPGFLWFIFPVFAVIWWPMSILLGRRPKVFAVVAAVLTIGFFLIVNIMTSFSHPWFIYPAFAVLWWPMAVLIGKGHARLFSVAAFLLINAFFITVNLITSPGYLWFTHITFAALWWPLSVFLARRKTIRIYSLLAALLTIGYLALVNYLSPSDTPWFLYAVYPLLLWPSVMFMGRHAARLPFSMAGSIAGIIFYLALNIFVSPGHPWILYLLLPLVWWPVTIAFRKVAANIMYLFISLTVFMAYYGILNIFVSPGHAWSLYLLYPYAWAAIGIYFGRRKMALGLAIAATVITGVFCSVLNLLLTPGTIWAVFPIFAILWWPISVYFFRTRRKDA